VKRFLRNTPRALTDNAVDVESNRNRIEFAEQVEYLGVLLHVYVSIKDGNDNSKQMKYHFTVQRTGSVWHLR